MRLAELRLIELVHFRFQFGIHAMISLLLPLQMLRFRFRSISLRVAEEFVLLMIVAIDRLQDHGISQSI